MDCSLVSLFLEHLERECVRLTIFTLRFGCYGALVCFIVKPRIGSCEKLIPLGIVDAWRGWTSLRVLVFESWIIV